MNNVEKIEQKYQLLVDFYEKGDLVAEGLCYADFMKIYAFVASNVKSADQDREMAVKAYEDIDCAAEAIKQYLESKTLNRMVYWLPMRILDEETYIVLPSTYNIDNLETWLPSAETKPLDNEL